MVIKDYENGLLVPKGNDTAIYNAMKEIINNSVLAEKLSHNAQKICDELSTDRILQKWIEVIGE